MTKKELLQTDKYCLAIFSTTHSALHAEKVLEEKAFTFIIVPTPREISEGCGLAIRFYCQDMQAIADELQAEGIIVNDFYEITKGHRKTIVGPIRTT